MLTDFFTGIRAFDWSHAPGGVRPADDHDWWFGGQSQTTNAGIDVDERVALTYSAVWAATRILTETIGRIPFILYRRVAEQDKEKARSHPLFRVLRMMANQDTAAMPYRETMSEWMINAGNALSRIDRVRGQVTGLWPISPHRVIRVERDDAGERLWVLRPDEMGADPEVLNASDVFHLPGALPVDSFWGRGVISHARESIGMGLATERQGASFFGHGANPSGVLEAPAGTLKDQKERDNLRSEWNRQYGQGKPHQGGVAILWRDIKYKPISISQKDAQFLETRQHNITEIARWYHVPPHMLADLSRATFSNIEEQSIAFVRSGVMPWLARWEQAVLTQLLSPAEQNEYFADFLPDELLRGDTKSRYESYALALLNGIMSINEVRHKENMDRIDNGDDHRVAMNTVAVGDERATAEMVREVTDIVAKMAAGKSGAEERLMEALDEAVARNLVPVATDIKDDVRNIADGIYKTLGEKPEPDITKILTAQEDRNARIESRGNALVRRALTESVRRMQSKAANAVRRIGGDSKTFLDKLATFYESHEPMMVEAIEPGLSMLRELGTDLDAARLAREHCEAAREALLEAYDTQPECTFAARINAICDKWMEGPESIVDAWLAQPDGEESCTQ